MCLREIKIYFLLGWAEFSALCSGFGDGVPQDGTNSVAFTLGTNADAFTLSFAKLFETSWSQLSGAPSDDIFPEF